MHRAVAPRDPAGEPGAPPAEGSGRRPRRDRGTYERLLAAARAVFRVKGLHAATVDDIVNAAHVSRGSFYVYFENKHDIFERLITPILDALYQTAGSRRPGSTIFARLEEGNRAYLETWQAEPDLMRLMFETNNDIETAARVWDMRSRFVVRSAKALRRHKEEGITHPEVDPDLAAAALAGMVTDFARQRFLTPRAWSQEELRTMSYHVTMLWYRAVYSSAAPPPPSPEEAGVLPIE